MTGNTKLINLIREQIASSGPVSFRWFMEQALYHPVYGYYASGRAAIGKQGDFFTSVSVGTLFGRLIAMQFAEIWERLGCPSPFTIVEQGANNGDFAADVLLALQTGFPACLAALRYVIIEPFEALSIRQRQGLHQWPQVSWCKSPDKLDPFCGVHFSNELLDAMPVHLVRYSGGKWNELHVDARFELINGPLDSSLLPALLASVPQIEGYRTEINLEALTWVEAMAAKLTRGCLLVIDYGFPQEIYYSPERTCGTLAGYANHRRLDNPIEAVGEADITAHVDFTRLIRHAEKQGLTLAGFTDQHHFMVGLGSRAFPDTPVPQPPDWQKTMRAFRTLMHPGLMGLAFKVVALQKGMDASAAPLTGFKFAPDDPFG